MTIFAGVGAVSLSVAVTSGTPLRFETLGGARVLRAGILLKAGTARPRELLLAMLARGGAPVSHLEICDALWPDADGDAARRAFDTTLHRLRNWLDAPNAICLSTGQLSLDFEHCTLDVREVELILNATELPWSGSAGLTQLYRGRFLPELAHSPVAARYRARLHERVLAHLARHGFLLEHDKRFAEAAELYRNALSIDDEHERFYQGLIRCAGESDRPSEVAAVLRRCVGTFAERFATAPSKETLTLARNYGVKALFGEATRSSSTKAVVRSLAPRARCRSRGLSSP